MASNQRALVLSGELLPGFAAADVWKAAAELFRMDQARFDSSVLARAPITIKESEDFDDLERRKTALSAIGAVSEVVAVSGDSFFVLIENSPRGPLPREFIEQRLHDGRWAPDLKAARVGSSDWRVFVPASAEPSMSTPAIAPTAIVVDSVDPADTVAAKIARVADSIASRRDAPLPLPAGDAIHAGFWRRCAAYLIDNLVLYIPAVLVLQIPLLGILIYFVGRWAYFALLESSTRQATLGKRALGIVATDSKGQRLSLGHASGRYFAGAISTITLSVGYALAGWTQRKQALHDLIADTCVVFNTVEPGQPLPTVRPPMPWYGWVANIVLLAIVPISIFAAVALPAYQDYVVRARIASLSAGVERIQDMVAESIAKEGPCDISAGIDDPLVESIRVSGNQPRCVIALKFAASTDAPLAISGQTIEWQHTGEGAWSCISTITPKVLPSSCRP